MLYYEGVCVFNEQLGQLDMRLASGRTLGGFGRNDPLEVLLPGSKVWMPTRAEINSHGWFFWGFPYKPIGQNIRVRIYTLSANKYELIAGILS